MTVRRTTAEGRATSYRVERTPGGSLKRTVTGPSGTSTLTITGNDGNTTVTEADGTRVEAEIGPDPRFGMQAPIFQRMSRTLPSGLRATTELRRDVVLDNASDALSVRRLTETSTTNDRVSTRTYDGLNRRFTGSAPSGRSIATDVDAQRRPVREVVEGLTPTTFAYDARGRASTAEQGVRRTRYGYDARGHVASFTDARNRTTLFDYDLADRLILETSPDGRRTSYGYDRNGNQTSLTPPDSLAHAFAFTARDLMERSTPPALASGPTPTQYAYDDDRQPRRITRADGAAVDLGYDAAGRLVSLAQARGTTRVTYSPLTGRLASAVAPGDERTTFAFDGALPTRWTYEGTVPGQVAHTYDSYLRLASEAVNGGTAINSTYDQDGLLATTGALTVTRDARHGLVSGASIGSSATTIVRNGFGEPESVTTLQGGATLYAETYARDDLGRITTKTARRGATTRTFAYGYDEADRLERVTRDGVLQATYDYDANGNRTEVTRGAGPPITAAYDAQDRLVRSGTTEYAYTADGELRSKRAEPSGDTTTYAYDATGALTAVALPGGSAIEYVIDAAGRRVAKKRDGQIVQRFVYGPRLGPVAELEADGSVRSRFIYATGLNVPDYMIRGGQRYRFVNDHLGSPRVVVNVDTGAVAQELEYDEFGRVTNDTNPGFQPFGFAGGIFDADTSLVRFGARDYDAEAGRFTAKDPLGFDGADTNLYGYGRQDPVNLTDATGMCPICIPILIGALVGAGTDLGMQVIGNKLRGCGAFDNIDWGSVAVNGVIGGATSGAGAWLGGARFGARAASQADDLARLPVGRRGSPIEIRPGSNAAGDIGGRPYSGHAFDRMQGRGIPPSAVEDAITHGTSVAGRGGTTIHYSSANNLSVVTGNNGNVVTVGYGQFRP